jgi:hypothetical protein
MFGALQCHVCVVPWNRFLGLVEKSALNGFFCTQFSNWTFLLVFANFIVFIVRFQSGYRLKQNSKLPA